MKYKGYNLIFYIGLFLIIVLLVGNLGPLLSRVEAKIAPRGTVLLEVAYPGELCILQNTTSTDYFNVLHNANALSGEIDFFIFEGSGINAAMVRALNGESALVEIPVKKALNGSLYVYPPVSNGMFSVVGVGNEKLQYDLASIDAEIEYFEVFPFQSNISLLILRALIFGTLCITIFVCACLLLLNAHKMPTIKILTQDVTGVFAILLIAFVFINNIIYYRIGIPNYLLFGDQLYYWDLLNNSDISNMATFRGYLTNYIPYSAQVVASDLGINPSYLYFGFTSILFGFSFGYCLPNIHFYLTGKRVKNYQNALLVLCFMFFWYGTLSAVLMDMPALCFFLISGMYLLKGFANKNFYAFFISGLAISVAINLRQSYKYSLIFFVICLIINIFSKLKHKTEKYRYIAISVGLLAFGILIIGAPQLYINYANHAHISLFPFDSNGSVNLPDIYFSTNYSLAEVSAHIAMSTPEGYPFVTIADNQIQYIKSTYSLPQSLLSIHQLLDMFLSKPTDTLIYIGKKLFLGFNVRTYISYPSALPSPMRINVFASCNYFIIGCALYYLYKYRLTKSECFALLIVFGTLILPQTLVHVEWRYFIVGYAALYYIVFFKFTNILFNAKKREELFNSNYPLFITAYIYLSQWIGSSLTM